MMIERIDTDSAFSGMCEEWNALLDDSESNSIFLTHEWLFTWWKHLAEGRALSIVTARVDGKLVGVLPVAVRPPQYTRMIPRSLELLGSGVIGSDYLDAIVLRGHEHEVMHQFAEYLAQMNLALRLSQLRRGACAVSELSRGLQQKGWVATESQINVCPFIDLRGQDWQEYLGTLGASQRYNFNRRLRGLWKHSEVHLEVVRSRESARGALDIVIDLHRKRWGSIGTSEAFQTESIIAFHRDFVERSAARGWLRILVLRIDGNACAALYGFRYGRTFYFYQSGFDPAYSKQSVGLVLMGLAIKSAIEEGVSEYDFLHGREDYKLHWARDAKELGRIELYPSHASGRVCKNAADLNRAARKVAREVFSRGFRA
jgi:CelD/BcsL family acetyltransferase involved in cellulose biosynthesis